MKEYICKYCGKDTSNVDYDYLIGFNHLACELGVWGAHSSINKTKKMKIKGWEKISGFTYKGMCIVNPIHNADETRYTADVLNLNLPQKPKWELSLLTPGHKWRPKGEKTFEVILWDESRMHSRKIINKNELKSISNFITIVENLIDELLNLQLTSAPTYSSHSVGVTPGILNVVNSNGTKLVYQQPVNIHVDLIDTIKELQKQIDELKQTANTPSNPF